MKKMAILLTLVMALFALTACGKEAVISDVSEAIYSTTEATTEAATAVAAEAEFEATETAPILQPDWAAFDSPIAVADFAKDLPNGFELIRQTDSMFAFKNQTLELTILYNLDVGEAIGDDFFCATSVILEDLPRNETARCLSYSFSGQSVCAYMDDGEKHGLSHDLASFLLGLMREVDSNVASLLGSEEDQQVICEQLGDSNAILRYVDVSVFGSELMFDTVRLASNEEGRINVWLRDGRCHVGFYVGERSEQYDLEYEDAQFSYLPLTPKLDPRILQAVPFVVENGHVLEDSLS
ncbi:MAG: hypothetical protein LBM12_01790 [Candidatus Nomurabacteria bacterium]|jgi:hypothetical protein|nr:hypothetical protein [Candidatus Nomurabacteria bacterium]